MKTNKATHYNQHQLITTFLVMTTMTIGLIGVKLVTMVQKICQVSIYKGIKIMYIYGEEKGY